MTGADWTDTRRKPPWLKVRIPTAGPYTGTAKVLSGLRLHTVCREARCPNVAGCWAAGTATIMILGETCTRACRFCAVGTRTQPPPPETDEPERVARAVQAMDLSYAVITSVTRDDLQDGGAAHFAQTVSAIRARCPGTKVELLIPDLQGDEEALGIVADAGPDVIGHNLETVRRLSALVRDPRTSYKRSLEVLRFLGELGAVTKSALLLGMGETNDEIEEALSDLRRAGVRHVALGQYLSPGPKHHPVERYLHPDRFAVLERRCHELGFESAACGPFVRSSYQADQYVGRCL